MHVRHLVLASIAWLLPLGACDSGGEHADAGVGSCARCGTGGGPGGAGGGAGAQGPQLASERLRAADAPAGEGVTFVDARSPEAYAAGHIPGARSLAVATLRAEIDGVGGQVPPPDAVASAIGMAGIEPGVPLLVYAAGSDLDAARLVWTLDLMGQKSVAMLDGGFVAWEAGGHDVAVGAPTPATTDYPSDMPDTARRVDVSWVLGHLDDPATILIDARSPQEYAAGHIPGALGFDWTDNVAAGELKPVEALRAMYAALPTDATLVAYCQSGSRASMAYFVLRYLGFSDVRLYDGSMAEWTADPSRPLE